MKFLVIEDTVLLDEERYTVYGVAVEDGVCRDIVHNVTGNRNLIELFIGYLQEESYCFGELLNLAEEFINNVYSI